MKEWPSDAGRAKNLPIQLEDKAIEMKDFSQLEAWTPKKLRTLRNNLNNRLESYKNSGGEPKELAASHMLAGLEYEQIIDLQKRVKKLLKDL